jgi:four helix bundle protein
MAQINDFRDLIVFKKAYDISMKIYKLTLDYPKEEKYALTDQIRRSSRSVCSNIAEAWAKKAYPKHFKSKLTDSLGEEYETETWLDYSRDCGYIHKEIRNSLIEEYQEVKRMLNSMINNPDKFGPK